MTHPAAAPQHKAEVLRVNMQGTLDSVDQALECRAGPGAGDREWPADRLGRREDVHVQAPRGLPVLAAFQRRSDCGELRARARARARSRLRLARARTREGR